MPTPTARDPAAPEEACPCPVESPGPANEARWRNPHRVLPRVRWAVQLAYLGFLSPVGLEFARFVSQVDERRSAPRRGRRRWRLPPHLRLVGLRRFLLTRYWDEIHPAGLTILLAAVRPPSSRGRRSARGFARSGRFSRALEWIGRRTLWRRRWPRYPGGWICRSRRSSTCCSGSSSGGRADAARGDRGVPSLPVQRAPPTRRCSSSSCIPRRPPRVIVGLVALSLVVKHLWCRYLCPYGALLGVASLLSPLSVRRDPDVCNDCRACTRACPRRSPCTRGSGSLVGVHGLHVVRRARARSRTASA